MSARVSGFISVRSDGDGLDVSVGAGMGDLINKFRKFS